MMQIFVFSSQIFMQNTVTQTQTHSLTHTQTYPQIYKHTNIQTYAQHTNTQTYPQTYKDTHINYTQIYTKKGLVYSTA